MISIFTAEVPTFLAAGHETTATATGWVLYELAKNPALQENLREELLLVDSDTPPMEELSELPYLDKVVREILRLHPPVTLLNREAAHDAVIPVSEPFVDAQGKLQRGIEVRRGNRIFVGIAAFQTSKEIWGEDALEFKCVPPLSASCSCIMTLILVALAFIGPTAGTIPRRRSRARRGCGAICSRSRAASARASGTASRSSSACFFFYSPFWALEIFNV